MRVLGFADVDEGRLREWADVVEEWFGGQGDLLTRFQRCQDALKEYLVHFEATAARIRSDKAARQKKDGDIGSPPRPSRCVIEDMLDAVEHGSLAVADVAPNVFFLLAAGHETTTSLLANSFLLLLDPRHTSQLTRLRQDPGLLETCLNELLRVSSPIKEMVRQVQVPPQQGHRIVFKGHELVNGQMVKLLNTCANMDPSVFPDPHVFDIRRQEARRHIAFGCGSHSCLGQVLGRAQARTVLQKVLVTRGTPFDHLHLAMDPEDVERLPLDSINMIKELHVSTVPGFSFKSSLQSSTCNKKHA
eukprot:CAMPEP_0197854528 /NCGR_PEP_ID=MMETSP1438-20131217/24836_1 /TAXON_ID=1461541 /ORGANISM="Pterosperma sp., Strain CCMP1384" /LENGTH=302 /DNA_ID=CAMNT_0043469293 /DNA_START=56 /DNA_END=964 /DNA_ORIENTATION=-